MIADFQDKSLTILLISSNSLHIGVICPFLRWVISGETPSGQIIFTINLFPSIDSSGLRIVRTIPSELCGSKQSHTTNVPFLIFMVSSNKKVRFLAI